MRSITGRDLGLISRKLDGPWPCERCKQLTQFAELTSTQNRIFCKNERCGFKRVVDFKNRTILEADGTVWAYNPLTGAKWRIRGR